MDRVKGITIEIGGDTRKLTDSLKDVNKSIKDTQSELKDVDKLLKFDPSNTELLAQKQELLGKALNDNKDKLEMLKQAQEQMNAEGIDRTSEQYRGLAREIEATEQEMQRLGDEAEKTDEKIIKVATGAEKVAEKTKKMADATSTLSKASAGALTGLVGLGVKAAKDADDLTSLAKQTGLSTEALQKMTYASDLIDVNVEDITGAIKKMKKQLDSGEDKFKAIGVSTKDVNGNLRDTETIFYETVRALGRIENETERDVIAMDIFGKSADSLAGILDDGGAALRQLGDEAKANGSIISQEDLDKANELNDSLDKLKAELGASVGQAAVQVAEALAPVIQSLAESLKGLAQHLKDINPTTIKIVAVILAVVAALSPLLSFISTLATILPIISVAIGAVSAPMLAIVGVIGLVVAAVVVLIKHWDDIKQAAVLLGQIIAETWDKIKTKTSEVWDGIKTKVSDTWTSIKTACQNGINAIKNFFANAKLNFPKIKMPHFKISGSFSLNPPKVPTISVDWYKKAYDDAYLLNSPTIFGASGGQLLGGGEGNGSEAVVGTEKLMSMIGEVVGSQNVNVILQGDAAEVFKLVRTENTRFMKSNGYSPLMR